MENNDAGILFRARLNRMLQKLQGQLTHQDFPFSIPATLKRNGVRLVSVAHELSSEIATAILAREDDTRRLKELKEVVERVHSVLQKLTTQCREQTRKRRLARSRSIEERPSGE